ncbi:Na(+)/citrate cotransporter-like isoform X2 [Ornithodoros turicata]|uniref:Na(+)/citrate cotransporter-like isoform X2 n=1 Tax=Ornithodoros turicata TaxID=34597 RepID=UPI0031395004
MTTAQSTAPYMKDVVMLLLAAMIMAVAVDHCNLHYRIALRILLLIGTSTMRVFLGFMLATVFISMWLQNTATVIIFIPIADAICSEIGRRQNDDDESVAGDDTCLYRKDEQIVAANPLRIPVFEFVKPLQNAGRCPCRSTSTDYTFSSRSPEHSQLRNAMLLAVAYATSIGGTGCILGTLPNYVLLGLVEEQYPDQTVLSFATWMMYNVPPMLVCTVFAWLYVYYVLVPRRYHACGTDVASLRSAISRQCDDLGRMSFQEGAVLAIFAGTMTAPFFRDPRLLSGWPSRVLVDAKIRDATPTMLGACLLFLVPARPTKDFSGPALMDWPSIQREIPWGVLLLVGGSLSIAAACEVRMAASGLPAMIASYFPILARMPNILLVTTMSVLASVITEVASNTATASIMLPISSYLARANQIHPLYLMIPITVAASFSFMLPMGTASNALVYQHGRISIYKMVRSGFTICCGCLAIELFCITTFGTWIFDLHRFPPWADIHNSTSPLLDD